MGLAITFLCIAVIMLVAFCVYLTHKFNELLDSVKINFDDITNVIKYLEDKEKESVK